MKIRFGFVSNSSSSSFAIYGKSGDTEKLLKSLDVVLDSFDIEEFLNDCDYFSDNYYEIQKHISEKFGLSCYIDYESPDHCYIGIEYSHLKKYETTKEFFHKAESVLGEDCKFICSEVQG